MKKVIFTLLLGTIFTFAGYTQTTVKGWSAMDDKKFSKKLAYGKGTGMVAKRVEDASQLAKFDKIGILGFSLYQPTYSDKKPFSVVTPYLTDAGSTFFVDEFFAVSLPEIRDEFAKSQSALLTPDEYLDTDEKIQHYNSVEFEHAKMWKMVGSISNKIRGGRVDDIKGAPKGYKYLLAVNADAKMWREIGKFTGEIELDAVLVIETTFGFDGRQIVLQKIEMALIGPNPVPYNKKHKKYYAPFGPVKGYLEGLNYGFVSVIPPKGGILIAKLKKGKITESHYEGIGAIYGRIAAILLAKTKADWNDILK